MPNQTILEQVRTPLATALSSVAGNVYSFVPESVIPPAVVVVPDSPYDVIGGPYPKKIASKVYADRMGNGDEASGDGFKFRGRGILQLTGKNNYFWFAASLEITPEQAVDYLETFEGACQSACWFWSENKLNRFVDADDFKGLQASPNHMHW